MRKGENDMRKMMTKEVTKTTIKIGKVFMKEGIPSLEQLPDVVVIGNVTMEKAQKEVNGMYDFPITVFGVQPETQVYEMDVLEFVKHATLKAQESDEEKAQRLEEEKAEKLKEKEAKKQQKAG
jgi:hypothetical protein